MSHVMRKLDLRLCKNKGADQLCSNVLHWGLGELDKRSTFVRPIHLREGFCATFVCICLCELFASFTLCLRDYTFARAFERHVSP